jgi:hypothetical protein
MLFRSPTFAKGLSNSAGLKELYLSNMSLTPLDEKTMAVGLKRSAIQSLKADLI